MVHISSVDPRGRVVYDDVTSKWIAVWRFEVKNEARPGWVDSWARFPRVFFIIFVLLLAHLFSFRR